MTQAQRDIKRNLKGLEYADEIGNISKARRRFGISQQSLYQWKQALDEKGEEGLINSKPCPENPKLRTPPDEEKILYLRRTYHQGQKRISWHLDRYHTIKISSSGVYQFLVRQGLNRLPQNAKKRQLATRRYEKQVPSHHIQVDVKFLNLNTSTGEKVRHCLYIFSGFGTKGGIILSQGFGPLWP